MKSFENKNQYQLYSKLKYKTNTSQKSNLYPIPTPPLKPSPWVSSMVSEVSGGSESNNKCETD